MPCKVMRIVQVGALLLAASLAMTAQSKPWENQVRFQLVNATRVLSPDRDLKATHEVYLLSLRSNTYQGY